VIAGGRGLKKAEHFGLIRELAEVLDAGIGASRETVDRGWIYYPHQVGLSGKTISPELYLCAGISGAVQHLAGIRTAKTIISINHRSRCTDPRDSRPCDCRRSLSKYSLGSPNVFEHSVAPQPASNLHRKRRVRAAQSAALNK